MKIRLFKFLSILFLVVIAACARIGYPSGGPIDKDPPVVTECIPAMRATNFTGKKVVIYFDEFVKFKDINTNFIISPPLTKKVTPVIKGKSVIVEFNEDLLPNTTYRLYFGNGISDNNQGNVLKNYEFVFSTGSYIDSLALRGRLVNSFDLTPDKTPYYVMLYSNLNDSMPRKQMPDYIAQTNDKGWFTFGHLRPDTFLIFALKDQNSNTRFDMPNEAIAFSDTTVHLTPDFALPDSVLGDTTIIDSLTMATFVPQIQLYSFTEEHIKQYLKKSDRPSPEKITFEFNAKVDDSLKITPINFTSNNWLLPDRKHVGDTISFWITDTSVIQLDTFRLQLKYHVFDSLENWVYRTDTIKMVYKKPKEKGRKKEQTISMRNMPAPFSVESNAQTGFDLNDRLSITASHPFKNIDPSRIQLTLTEEDKTLPVKFTIQKDSNLSRKMYLIINKLEPKAKYKLSIDTLAFTSIWDQNNDSVGYEFESQRDDYYGTIILMLSGVKDKTILQVFSGTQVVQQKMVQADGKYTFTFLKPGKYKLKAIIDSNHNGIWDTGNFGKRIQPEKVFLYTKEINLRSNFDMEESWELK
jgi:uncharacterized protein (DUF2141 family)